MALIAGLPQAPSVYSPYNNIELAKKRRNQVLGRMLKMRYIDKKTYEEAKAEPIKLSTMPTMYATNKAPYFCDYVMKDLQKLGFTEEDITRIKEFSNPKNRTEGKGTPQFLYNLIYNVETRVSTESHIKRHSFLKKNTNAHDMIHEKLDLVQADILNAAKKDTETKEFLEKLLSADSYAWRVISDSGNRSFHSMGLAIDVLPKGWGQKNLYWAWRRDIDPDNWMKLPLERRWMPSQKVIEIFEKHGFIWGGKWIIWDNMHFEYRPEVILFNK